MTVDERLAHLEKRMLDVEMLTAPLVRLGPRTDHEQMQKDREESARRITEILEANRKAAEAIPVDRDCRVLTDGSPVTPGHREIEPATGMQKGYVVLCETERKKGFVRPVRRSYRHNTCGAVTTMGIALAETYARDPLFYSGTFCATCHTHFPLDQFVWEGTSEVLGS